ncbi:T9SS type A sorting domain-containing protein [Aestuariibaculum suncheonense]|uniref:T9SS type A sorting domain-containing protein n=1 Tax=Aestuariibaculum suncheonense TaxID=1028745 RepID=A0A8J6UIE8_9FLAO|nr:T9SS type A sorting domain-containing protein [Aestuariibaculum suncheonense]MBD0834106.1 T9SS type A sorting domain-containing protein [Aestuariibaculum suncheonense]
MKKLYFLFFTLLVTSLSFGQNLIVNGDFESWTGGILDTWNSESGTTITQETTTIAEGTYSAKFEITTTDQGITDFRQSVNVIAGTTYTVSVQIYQVDALSRARIYAETYQNYSNETLVGEWQTVSYEYIATSTSSVEFGLRFYDNTGFTNSSTIIVDNFRVVAKASPSIVITSPTTSSLINSQNIDIDFSVQNFNVANSSGDGYIKYSLDAGSLIDKYDTNTISLTNLSYGVHTINMELVDNNGDALSSPATSSITFTTYEVQTLPYIDHFDYTVDEALGAQTSWTNYFTGDDVIIQSGSLSYASLNGTGNSITFDGSGTDPVLDYTPTSSGRIYAAFMLKVTAFDASSIDGYFAVLRTNGGDYESRLWISPTSSSSYRIGISNGATLSQINTPTTDYTLDETIFVVFNYDIDNNTVNAWINPSLGETEPTPDISEASNSSGNTFTQFLIRQDSSTKTPSIVMDELIITTSWTAATPLALSNKYFNIEGFNMFPNPTSLGYVNVTSKITSNMNIEVFDLLGKQVLKQAVNNNKLYVSELKAGVYIMKVSQDGATSTKKLVIK